MPTSRDTATSAVPERRVDEIVRGMSLAERIGQLNHPSASTGAAVADGEGESADGLEERVRRGEVGWLAAGRDLGRLHELQRVAHEESPNGVPLAFTLDVVHGHRTVFPLPLALACSWDETLIRDCARVAAVEAGCGRRRAVVGADARCLPRRPLGALRGEPGGGSAARRDGGAGDRRGLRAARSLARPDSADGLCQALRRLRLRRVRS